MSRLPHRLEERNRLRSSVARNIKRTRKRSAAAISAVRAELIGTNRATALGIKAHNPSPVVALCRTLVEAGHDPATPLLAYRGNTLALKVRSIGEGAKLTVGDSRIGKPVFRRWRDRAESSVPAPPIAPSALEAAE
jgi:hypothetical protein